MTTLLPCPFCSAEPWIARDGPSDERSGYNFAMEVRCACGAVISKPSHKGIGGWCDDKGEALADVTSAWNRRVSEKS